MQRTSKASVVRTPTTTPQKDELQIHTFGVGHGDCILVEVQQAGRAVFRMLSDAGKDGPHVESIIAYLNENKRPEGIDLDLVILSHVDSDHQGGLHRLLAEPSIQIGTYWGPCLPAFRRVRWLFSNRVQHAVDTAALLEKTLTSRAIPILYPMEGHSDRWMDGKVTLSVISPPARLLKRLLYGSKRDLLSLIGTRPTPLEWLFGPVPEVDEHDETGHVRDLEQRTFSSPSDFPYETPVLPAEPDSSGLFAGEGIEPDFMGNRVLNDTSLVIALDVWLDGKHRRRMLFTGDQENWAYIASRHPAGLGVDVLKVPHHGGMVYLADRKDDDQEEKDVGVVEQTYLWLRPRIAIVSASGTHKLPHNRVRDALRAVGAAVLCTNVRGAERITSRIQSSSAQRSCHSRFECGKSKQPLKSVLILTSDAESMDRAGCVSDSGARGALPIVVMTQRLVEPDDAFLRWTGGELEKHATWLKAVLMTARNEFASAASNRDLMAAVACEPVAWRHIGNKARVEGRRHFLESPYQVLHYARSRGLIWSNERDLRARHESAEFYVLPNAQELAKAKAFVGAMPNLVFEVPGAAWNSIVRGDKPSILSSADTESLCCMMAAKLHLPRALVAEEVMPHILLEVAENFAFRACNFDYPRQLVDASHTKLLHLQRIKGKSKDVPNLFNNSWKTHVFSRSYQQLRNDDLLFLLDEAQQSGFIGPLVRVDGRGHGLGDPFEKFIERLNSAFDRHENTTFATMFEKAEWLEVP